MCLISGTACKLSVLLLIKLLVPCVPWPSVSATKMTGLILGDTFTQSVKPDKPHITQETQRRQRLPVTLSSLVTAAMTQRPLRVHRQTCHNNLIISQIMMSQMGSATINRNLGWLLMILRRTVRMLEPSVFFQTKIQNMRLLQLTNSVGSLNGCQTKF